MNHRSYPPAMRRLVGELSKLPSIGEKTAIRLAYHLLTKPAEDAYALAESLRSARDKTLFCQVCYSLTEDPVCAVCCDTSRDQAMFCVVEKPADVIAMERAGRYRGQYHVLHGLWSPLRGISPSQTTIGALIERVEKSCNGSSNGHGVVKELVLATSTTVEGDATALYIAKHISRLGVKITRIAQGLPKGGELEYADDTTIGHAIEGRREVKI